MDSVLITCKAIYRLAPNYFRELVESVQGRTIKDFFSREKSSKHLNLRLRLVWLQH